MGKRWLQLFLPSDAETRYLIFFMLKQITFITRYGFVLAVICSSVTGCMYSSKAQKKLLHEVEGKTFDVAVVPGVPFENGKWSRTMKGRIYWVKYLYDRGIVKNIMFSGSAVYSPFYEAQIMELYAAAIGIPEDRIMVETAAEHSTENIYYSYQKAKAAGFTSIALVSDPFQTRTLRKFTRKKMNGDITLIPMVVDTMKILEASMLDNPPIDSMLAFKNDFISIKKREGFFKRLKGTLGLKLKKLEK